MRPWGVPAEEPPLTLVPLPVPEPPPVPVVPAAPADPATTAVPNAESAEFSRECEIEGLLLPVEGGLKKESGKFRIRRGTCKGRFESGLRTVSKRACRSDSEFWSTRTTRLFLDNWSTSCLSAILDPGSRFFFLSLSFSFSRVPWPQSVRLSECLKSLLNVEYVYALTHVFGPSRVAHSSLPTTAQPTSFIFFFSFFLFFSFPSSSSSFATTASLDVSERTKQEQYSAVRSRLSVRLLSKKSTSTALRAHRSPILLAHDRVPQLPVGPRLSAFSASHEVSLSPAILTNEPDDTGRRTGTGTPDNVSKTLRAPLTDFLLPKNTIGFPLESFRRRYPVSFGTVSSSRDGLCFRLISLFTTYLVVDANLFSC